VLNVIHRFSRLELDHRTQRLQFEKISVGEYLKIASEIGVLSPMDNYRTLKEKVLVPVISAPTG
jgi:hypothetical protein